MAKYLRKRKSIYSPGEKLLGLAGVLFCLVLVTTAMMGGMFARYSTSGEGSDSARVAKFGTLTVTETGDFDGTEQKKGMIIPGVPLTKNIALDFTGSELATIVFVRLDLSDNWKLDGNTFSVVHHNGTEFLSWQVAEGWTLLENTQYVFYRELPPNTVLEDVAFTAGDGTITVSEWITEATIGTLEDTHINIQAGVIQSGGFETVADAWEALEGK